MAENHFADLDCEFEDEEMQMMGTLDVNEDQPIRVTFAMNGGSEDIGALEAGAQQVMGSSPRQQVMGEDSSLRGNSVSKARSNGTATDFSIKSYLQIMWTNE